MNTSWILLIVAGLLEVCWATSLKATAGFTRPWPTVLFVSTLVGSLILLSVAVRSLPVGTAYAVWVGIGAAGTAIASAIIYKQALSAGQIAFLLLLIISIVGLKLTTASH